MAAVEAALLQTSKVPANAGHALHKGTPRESFIRQFLEEHLAENLAIGQGEIVSADSRPGEQRNQFDIVIYKKSYPKLSFGGGINAFLVESVVATIEVKSALTKDELRAAFRAARNIKVLRRERGRAMWVGYLAPAPLNLVVAYDGPAQMKTVRNWILELHAEEGVALPQLPGDDAGRHGVAAASIDGVFLLGRGFVQFDNLPIHFVSAEARRDHPDMRYYVGSTADGTLLVFFVFLAFVAAGLIVESSNLAPYLDGFQTDVIIASG